MSKDIRCRACLPAPSTCITRIRAPWTPSPHPISGAATHEPPVPRVLNPLGFGPVGLLHSWRAQDRTGAFSLQFTTLL